MTHKLKKLSEICDKMGFDLSVTYKGYKAGRMWELTITKVTGEPVVKELDRNLSNILNPLLKRFGESD